MPHSEALLLQWKLPWMATANDKNVSDARWQAHAGPAYFFKTTALQIHKAPKSEIKHLLTLFIFCYTLYDKSTKAIKNKLNKNSNLFSKNINKSAIFTVNSQISRHFFLKN